MIHLSTNSVQVGDTLRMSWDLPTGARILRGPTGNDTLVVVADTSHPGQWTLQPLSAGTYALDSLAAVGPAGDTLRPEAARWQTRSRIEGSDTLASQVLPPQEVPVPFPWDRVVWGASGAMILVALFLLFRWWKKHRSSAPPPPPAVPPRDPVDLARERLLEQASRAKAGVSSREVAFACGEILREVHGSLHSWSGATGSTSGQWLQWCREGRPLAEQTALGSFLQEADALRYADAANLAAELLARAETLLATIDAGRRR